MVSRGELFPGGVVFDSYYDDAPFIPASEAVTPGSELFRQLLARLGRTFATVPSYTKDLVASLDVDEVLDSPDATVAVEPADLLVIAQALTLVFQPRSEVTSTTSAPTTPSRSRPPRRPPPPTTSASGPSTPPDAGRRRRAPQRAAGPDRRRSTATSRSPWR